MIRPTHDFSLGPPLKVQVQFCVTDADYEIFFDGEVVQSEVGSEHAVSQRMDVEGSGVIVVGLVIGKILVKGITGFVFLVVFTIVNFNSDHTTIFSFHLTRWRESRAYILQAVSELWTGAVTEAF